MCPVRLLLIVAGLVKEPVLLAGSRCDLILLLLLVMCSMCAAVVFTVVPGALRIDQESRTDFYILP